MHPDGLMMATGSDNGNINIWDIRVQGAVGNLQNHKSAIDCLQFSEKKLFI
jgi:WD40 repeat protein